SHQRRFLLFEGEPHGGTGQQAGEEDGGQRDVQRVPSRQPRPDMASHRGRRHEQAVADDGQSRRTLDAPWEVENEATEVADDEGEWDARDTDQELRHVTISLGSTKLIPRL